MPTTPVVLAVAFSLSAVHTVYADLAGISDPTFTPTTPTTWLFYAVGFGSIWLARRPQRPAQLVLLGYLLLLVGVTWERRRRDVEAASRYLASLR